MENESVLARRELLSLLAASVPVGATGCLGGDESSQEAGEAESAAETLFVRVRDGDVEGANEMIADEGPIGGLNESEVEEAEYVEVDAEAVVVEGESAIVRVTLVYESGTPDELEVGVRKVDGEWLVWEQLNNR